MINQEDNKIFKWLITGGAGFIGSHLVETLSDEKNHIICVDDLSSGNIDNLIKTNLIKFERKKIQDWNLENTEIKLDGIFHLAAQASVPFSMENMFLSSSNNLLGTLKVFEIAKSLNVPIVYASSSAIYGNLKLGDDELDEFDILSPYAQDKLTMENYAKMCWEIFRIPSVGLRFFNVYGPRQDPLNPYSGVISIFLDKLLKNQPIVVNGGNQTRDFIFVEDVCNTLIKSMNTLIDKPTNNNFNVGTGISTSVNQLVSLISKIIDVKPEIIYKKLPEGDPERSEGVFWKIKNFLDVDARLFAKINFGLEKTIKSLKA